jgi:hypothetical protein
MNPSTRCLRCRRWSIWMLRIRGSHLRVSDGLRPACRTRRFAVKAGSTNDTPVRRRTRANGPVGTIHLRGGTTIYVRRDGWPWRACAKSADCNRSVLVRICSADSTGPHRPCADGAQDGGLAVEHEAPLRPHPPRADGAQDALCGLVAARSFAPSAQGGWGKGHSPRWR